MATNDVEVLEALLELLLRPAQRLNSLRNSLRHAFTISTDRIMCLAKKWDIRDTFSFSLLCDEHLVIPSDALEFNYRYFKKLGEVGTKFPKSKRKRDEHDQEGIIYRNFFSHGKSDLQSYLEIVVDFNYISEEFLFEIYHKIRVTCSLKDFQARKALLKIRFLALALLSTIFFFNLAYISPEEITRSNLLVFEPNIFSDLADLLRPDGSIGFV